MAQTNYRMRFLISSTSSSKCCVRVACPCQHLMVAHSHYSHSWLDYYCCYLCWWMDVCCRSLDIAGRIRKCPLLYQDYDSKRPSTNTDNNSNSLATSENNANERPSSAGMGMPHGRNTYLSWLMRLRIAFDNLLGSCPSCIVSYHPLFHRGKCFFIISKTKNCVDINIITQLNN